MLVAVEALVNGRCLKAKAHQIRTRTNWFEFFGRRAEEGTQEEEENKSAILTPPRLAHGKSILDLSTAASTINLSVGK